MASHIVSMQGTKPFSGKIAIEQRRQCKEDEELSMFETQRKNCARIQDLKDEIQHLIDDQEYTEFLTEISKEKPLEKHVTEDPNDKDYIPHCSTNERMENNGTIQENTIENVNGNDSISESS